MTDKLAGAMGLARRAGALVAGFDAVCDAAVRGEAQLVLLAADTSDKTRRNIRHHCAEHCDVRDIPLTQDDVAALIGKKAGVLAVTDKNLAGLCLKALEPPTPPTNNQ